MFEENENIYPVKPELLVGGIRKNRSILFFFVIVLILLSSDLLLNNYIFLAEALLVLAIHELGHYVMMRHYKAKAQGMFVMSYLGNLNRTLRFSDSLRQQTIINLMGPLPGVLLGCALFLTVLSSEPNIYLLEVALLFIAINVVNLIPLDPFDGGRIIGGFFFNENDQLKMIFTLVSSVVIIGAGVFYNFIPLVVFGFLMGLKVRSFQKSKNLHDQLQETNVDYKKDYRDLTNREYWKIRNTFLRNNPKLKEMIPSGYTLWENERLLMEQVRQLLRVDLKPDISVLGRVLVVALIIALIALPLWLVFSNYELIDWYLENANF